MLRLVGLRLSETKMRIANFDEGFDFLSFRIQRHQKRGTGQRLIGSAPGSLAAQNSRTRGARHRAGRAPAGRATSPLSPEP